MKVKKGNFDVANKGRVLARTSYSKTACTRRLLAKGIKTAWTQTFLGITRIFRPRLADGERKAIMQEGSGTPTSVGLNEVSIRGRQLPEAIISRRFEAQNEHGRPRWHGA